MGAAVRGWGVHEKRRRPGHGRDDVREAVSHWPLAASGSLLTKGARRFCRAPFVRMNDIIGIDDG